MLRSLSYQFARMLEEKGGLVLLMRNRMKLFPFAEGGKGIRFRALHNLNI